MEHWVQFLVYAWEKDQFDGGSFWEDEMYLEYVMWMKRMGWRVDTERVFYACFDRMFLGCYEKVRRKRVASRFEGRCGVATSHVRRYRYVMSGAADVQRAIDKFLG